MTEESGRHDGGDEVRRGVDAPVGVAVLSLAAALMIDELLGYNAVAEMRWFFGQPVTHFTVLMVVQVLMSATVLVVAINISRLVTSCFLWWVAIGSCVISTMMSLLGAVVDVSGWVFSCAFLVGCIGSTALKFVLLGTLTAMSDRQRDTALLLAVFVQAAASPICYLGQVPIQIIAGFLGAASAVGFRLLAKGNAGENAETFKEVSQRNRASVVKVAFAVVVVTACFSYFSPMAFLDVDHMISAVFFTFLTHALSALLLGLFLGLVHDESFTLTFRLVFTLCILSFGLIPVFGSNAVAPAFLSTVAYSFFLYSSLLAIARFASMSSADQAIPFSLYGILMGVAAVLGVFLARADTAFAGDGGYSIVAVGMLVVVVISAFWLVTGKDLQNFFWGNQIAAQPELANAVEPAMLGSSRIEVIAEANKLSPRECEVFRLVVEGRSAAVIAEMLFLSESTVRKHVVRIYQKCAVHSKQELLALVYADGGQGSEQA